MTLPDREKVIQSLEQCTDTTGHRVDCYGCYQDGPGFGFVCRENLMRDALALLREQEPVRPEHIRSTIRSFGSDGFRDECSVDSYKCGNCHKAIEDTHSFCPWCGRAVKWRA